VVIIGDFNHPSVDWSTLQCEKEAEEFVDCVNDGFLFQHVLEPTRDKNVLDLVFSSEEHMICDVSVCEPLANSDHCIVEFLAIGSERQSEKKGVIRNYRRVNWEAFNASVNSVDWDRMLTSKDSNQQWQLFCDKLDSIVEEHVPVKKTSGSKKPMWMTRETLTQVKKKRKKWKQYRESGCQEDFEAYRQCQNETTRKIREDKKDFETKLAKNIKSGTKSFHAYARD
jgi:hypothetical protein